MQKINFYYWKNKKIQIVPISGLSDKPNVMAQLPSPDILKDKRDSQEGAWIQ